ncbi:DNA repair protein RecN [uncultured Microbacterium sp.]|uniref:DNA repair protein RecN n=1 Tax=uncultured Microbacterium sp. TaxID=191216 RepID=UPI0025F632C0|nr:DNA repair protein RecN [uncultured Microbacterium sp.]
MIEEMRIRGLGVISDATLPLGPGFTAITGETGAGKTMVVTGLGLLLGARSDAGVVRKGARGAEVAGVWIVPAQGAVADRVADAGGELEPAGDGLAELYVGRTVSAEGRSRASVGGRAAPAGVLADLASALVTVHGQSDQLRLRSAQAQRDALDRFGGDDVARARETYASAWEAWRRVSDEHATLAAERDDRVREATELRAALVEIAEIEPLPGEDAELTARSVRLANVEELRAGAALAREALSSEDLSAGGGAGDVLSLIGEARRALERAGERDPRLAELGEAATDLGIRASELAADLSAYLADLDDAGPAELEAVEERRATLAALVRRHAPRDEPTLDGVIELARTGAARLDELDGDDERIEQLQAERDALALQLDDAAAALTRAREAAATVLGDAVTTELAALAMPDARLIAEVTPAIPSAHGRDEVSFLLAPHPGAEPRPLARGASGGELSRVMLALEVVIAGVDPVPTFVFDEVDAGVGGAAAIEIGRRLARLAEASQVIVVTHLAQVAAFATNHLTVVKGGDGSVTESSVQRLEGAEREAEMARLLSGLADSDAAITHARELLALARVTA